MLNKIKSYGINKVQNAEFRKEQTAFMKMRGEKALEALRPEPLSMDDVKEAWFGRHADDGVTRFREEIAMNGWDERDLHEVHMVHRKTFQVSLLLAALCTPAALWFIMSGNSSFNLLAGLIFMIFMFAFAVKAFGADYAAFQIKNRKFCSIKTYLQDGFFKAS